MLKNKNFFFFCRKDKADVAGNAILGSLVFWVFLNQEVYFLSFSLGLKLL